MINLVINLKTSGSIKTQAAGHTVSVFLDRIVWGWKIRLKLGSLGVSKEPSKSEPYLLVAAHLRRRKTGKLWRFAWLLSLCQVLLSCCWDTPSVLEPTSPGRQWRLKSSSCLGVPQNTRSRPGPMRQPVSRTNPLPDQLSESQRAFLMGDSHCRIARPQPVSHSSR